MGWGSSSWGESGYVEGCVYVYIMNYRFFVGLTYSLTAGARMSQMVKHNNDLKCPPSDL